MNKRLYIISIEAEYNPGILNRVLHIFSRRKINISTLRVAAAGKDNIQQISIVIQENEITVARLLPQIEKQVDVFNASYCLAQEALIINN